MSAWDDAALANDADLRAFESVMPEAAKKIKGESTASAYDGKRALAKDKIGRWLVRRGYALSGISTPAEFGRAATLLELSLIYRDMARRADNVSTEKAEYYETEYGDEIENLQFTYTGSVADDTQKERPSALLWRG